MLARLLGEGYEIGNFGHSGTTLLRHGHRPYVDQKVYGASLDFKPDIAIIHLGVNDTDPGDWPDYSDEFITDYVDLIESYRQVNPDMRIMISELTPLGPPTSASAPAPRHGATASMPPYGVWPRWLR